MINAGLSTSKRILTLTKVTVIALTLTLNGELPLYTAKKLSDIGLVQRAVADRADAEWLSSANNMTDEQKQVVAESMSEYLNDAHRDGYQTLMKNVMTANEGSIRTFTNAMIAREGNANGVWKEMQVQLLNNRAGQNAETGKIEDISLVNGVLKISAVTYVDTEKASKQPLYYQYQISNIDLVKGTSQVQLKFARESFIAESGVKRPDGGKTIPDLFASAKAWGNNLYGYNGGGSDRNREYSGDPLNIIETQYQQQFQNASNFNFNQGGSYANNRYMMPDGSVAYMSPVPSYAMPFGNGSGFLTTPFMWDMSKTVVKSVFGLAGAVLPLAVPLLLGTAGASGGASLAVAAGAVAATGVAAVGLMGGAYLGYRAYNKHIQKLNYKMIYGVLASMCEKEKDNLFYHMSSWLELGMYPDDFDLRDYKDNVRKMIEERRKKLADRKGIAYVPLKEKYAVISAKNGKKSKAIATEGESAPPAPPAPKIKIRSAGGDAVTPSSVPPFRRSENTKFDYRPTSVWLSYIMKNPEITRFKINPNNMRIDDRFIESQQQMMNYFTLALGIDPKDPVVGQKIEEAINYKVTPKGSGFLGTESKEEFFTRIDPMIANPITMESLVNQASKTVNNTFFGIKNFFTGLLGYKAKPVYASDKDDREGMWQQYQRYVVCRQKVKSMLKDPYMFMNDGWKNGLWEMRNVSGGYGHAKAPFIEVSPSEGVYSQYLNNVHQTSVRNGSNAEF